MNNIIEKDEDFLGYVKDIKKEIQSHMKELEQAEEFGIIEMLQDLLEDLENEQDYQLICVMYNPMGSYFYKKATVIDSETKEEIF